MEVIIIIFIHVMLFEHVVIKKNALNVRILYFVVLVTIVFYMYVITSNCVTEIKTYLQLFHTFANYFHVDGKTMHVSNENISCNLKELKIKMKLKSLET